MEKHDYVICSWCGADDVPYFEYHYLYNITHNEAVDEAKFNSNQQTLYNHKDCYSCEFVPAPRRYNFPELRTTIDTYSDYFRAVSI